MSQSILTSNQSSFIDVVYFKLQKWCNLKNLRDMKLCKYDFVLIFSRKDNKNCVLKY